MRQPITPRSELPFSRLDAVLIQMIEAHAGKPCPTRAEIRQWTGMPRRRIWVYLGGMVDRGLIEIEVRGAGAPKLRRMRSCGGEWTLWTQRDPGRPRDECGRWVGSTDQTVVR